MATVIFLLIGLALLHYVVAFYTTLARRLVGLLSRQLGRPPGGGEVSGEDWPTRL